MQYLKFFLLVAALCLAHGQDEEICPDGELDWPHHECNLFYLCDGFGGGEVLECPPGLYWNPRIHNCDFPVNVPECVEGTRPPTGTTTPMPTTDITTEPTPSPTTVTTPTTPTTPTTLPTTPTPSETTVTPTTSTSTAPPPTTEDTPETEEPLTSTTTRLPPGVCPETGIHKIAHPELCDAYYLCVHGERQEPHSTCPEGLYFDPSIEECNLAEEVDCENGPTTNAPPSSTTTMGTTTEPTFPECPSEGVHYLPYPGNCTLYIVCMEGTAVIYRCPGGTLFDTVKRTCEPESTAVCTVKAESQLFGHISHLRRQEEAVKLSKNIIMTGGKAEIVVKESDVGFFQRFLNLF